MRSIKNFEKKFLIAILLFGLYVSWFFGWSGGVVVAQITSTDSSQTFVDTTDDIQTQIEKQEKLLEELRAKAEEQEKDLQKTQQYADTLKHYIDSFNNDLYRLEGKINIKKEELYSTQLAIQRVNFQIEEKEADIQHSKDQMTVLFQEIYKNDLESIVELLLKYESISIFFNQVNARQSLSDAIIIKLGDLKRFKNELEQAQNILAKEKQQLQKDEIIFRNQKIILEQKKIAQNQLLKQTRQQETGYQEVLKNTLAKEQEIRLEVFELEEQLRYALDPSSIPEARAGLLRWPTEGFLTQPYGCIHDSFARRAYPSCDNGKGGFHNGLDIALYLGAPIRAAQGGKVVAVGSSPYAYGNWVAVEHATGLTTAYAHMSGGVRSVSVGQIIRQGDVVGYMDTTGFSTGSHLHFMVYVASTFRTKPSRIAGVLPIGATLDPIDYLE